MFCCFGFVELGFVVYGVDWLLCWVIVWIECVEFLVCFG